MKKLLLFASLFIVTLSFAQTHSIHEEQLKHYGQYQFTKEEDYNKLLGINASKPSYSKKGKACNLTHDVYGWHPFWVGTAYNNYDFSLLSTFSYFSYELNPSTGRYNTIHSWRTTPSINLAQAAGCRVELCVTNFGATNNSTFLTNATAKQTFIDTIIALIQYRNADGVNIDFEGIPSSQRNNLTSFMTSLSTQLKAAIPGATVTMAILSVDWNNVFDIAALNNVVDKFIIMGYGYYYSGSSQAGPTAPLWSAPGWTNYNLTRSVNYYLNQGVTPGKLVLGLPYYGYEWETVSSSIPSNTTGGFSSARTYKFIKDNTSGNYSNRQFSQQVNTPYYVYPSSGNFRQAFADDEFSLARDYDMIKRKGIGGMGIWALGYDDGYNQLWDLIRDKFTTCSTDPCSDTLYDMGGPFANYYDDEDYTFTISPPNAQRVKLSFQSFDVELNYDTLFVYDGPSTSSTLLGNYTGNTLPPNLTANSGQMTLRFYSDGATTRPGWQAVWQCEYDTIIPTTQIAVNGNWQTQNFTANFTDNDIGSGLNQQFYQVIHNNNIDWRANAKNGFFSDNFNGTTIHSDWTSNTGTWINNSGLLQQTDENLSNTNIYAELNQNDTNAYLYHWQLNIDGVGTNRRAGFHFMCDSVQLTNRGNSYFVWYRVDDNKIQIYKVINDVFTLEEDVPYTLNANQWYDVKVVYNKTTGDIDVYTNDKLSASWTDASPLIVGKHISFRSGNCKYTVNNVKVYKARGNNVLVTVGQNMDAPYENYNPTTPSCRVKSIVTDSMKNISAVASLDVNIDWTNPDTVIVFDGNTVDIDTFYTQNQIEANWTLSADTNSGVTSYWYAIGDSYGDSNIVAWTNNGLNNFLNISPSLNVGTTYYVSVRAENGAGLISQNTSNGQLLLWPLSINQFKDGSLVKIFPNPSKGFINIQISSNEDKTASYSLMDINGKIIIRDDIQLIKGINVFSKDLSLFSAGTYFINIEYSNTSSRHKIVIQ